MVHITKNCFIDFQNQWPQLWGKYNWYTMTFIEIMFEDDAFTGGYEFIFIVLGIGFRVRYNTEEFYKKLKEWELDI